ncbi:hypothetical protein JG687_00008740 [Phytophthora cactorum]|uniref:Calpain catalytic domain-containing protein n=1 Tax=Phytophthora cactorum TaxID=29920 RepID=A0A8T1UE10_9STRA|nr:hypothetical protein JG687_00008740 [Phytophthora cactorum]
MPRRALTIDSSASSALAVEDEIIQWLSSQVDDATGSVPLYEDPDFASEISSLYFDPNKLPDYVPQQSRESSGHVSWYRPTEYTEDPDYFKSSAGCGDLREGLLNDAWLLGVFAAVALHPDNLIENLFVSESLQSFKQFGVFTCRFFKDDNWMPVTTDTRIPYSMELQPEDKVSRGIATFSPGSALYGSSVDRNEVFVLLLEKAYAKLHGSYQVLDEKYGGGIGGSAGTSSGRILEAFLDCTGGSAHRVDLQQERVKQLQFDQATAGSLAASASSPSMLLWKQLLRYKRKKCILTTQLRQLSFNSQDVTAMGIVKNRQYVILHVTEVGIPSGQGGSGSSREEVLRFVKLKTVWGRGMWKGEWSNDDSKWEEHTQVEQAMRSDPRYLLDTFTELFVVHVFQPDDRQYSVRGDWFKLTVPLESLSTGNGETTVDKSVNGVLLSLTQRDFRLYGGDNYAINFVLLLSSGQAKTLPERELVKEDVTISPGAAYYLIPYTTNPKVEMEFFLRVVAPQPDDGELTMDLQMVIPTVLLGVPALPSHVLGKENPAWCQNPQFWIRFAERSPRELRRLRKLLSAKAHVTIKVVLRGSGKLLHPAEEGGGSNSNPIVINGRPWSETDFVPLHSVSSPPDLVLSAAAKGGYVIVPTTYEPGRLGKFVLSVQCDTEFTLTCEAE